MTRSDHTRSQPARAVSPSLVAAKNVNVNRDFLDDGERKVMIVIIMILVIMKNVNLNREFTRW